MYTVNKFAIILLLSCTKILHKIYTANNIIWHVFDLYYCYKKFFSTVKKYNVTKIKLCLSAQNGF